VRRRLSAARRAGLERLRRTATAEGGGAGLAAATAELGDARATPWRCAARNATGTAV